MTIENQAIETETEVTTEIENENATSDPVNDEIVTKQEQADSKTDQPQTEVEDEWKPDFKYKAYGEEKEMDEWVRAHVNKENYEQFTKLFSRAGGFDIAKEKLEAERSRVQEFEERFGTINEEFGEIQVQRDRLVKSIETGNMREMYNILGVNEDAILSYAEELVAAKMGDQTQQQMFEQKYEQKTQQLESEFEKQKFESERQKFMQEQHEWEMQNTFSRPDVSPVIEEYNSRANDPNAFKNVVQQIGLNEYYTSGKNISVMEAVERAKQMLGLTGQTPQKQQPENPQPEDNVQPIKKEKPKAIPNFGGSGSTTPVKKRPMRISDLENEYKQISAQG